jgi:hypothetical protein
VTSVIAAIADNKDCFRPMRISPLVLPNRVPFGARHDDGLVHRAPLNPATSEWRSQLRSIELADRHAGDAKRLRGVVHAL